MSDEGCGEFMGSGIEGWLSSLNGTRYTGSFFCMRYVTDIFELFSEWMRDELWAVSMAIIATILIIFGNDINRAVRKLIKNYSFFVRLLIFIALCAFGYGLAAVMTAKLLAGLLGSLGNSALSPVVILVFVALGFIAEHKNHM
jgi:hypothetical protein